MVSIKLTVISILIILCINHFIPSTSIDKDSRVQRNLKAPRVNPSFENLDHYRSRKLLDKHNLTTNDTDDPEKVAAERKELQKQIKEEWKDIKSVRDVEVTTKVDQIAREGGGHSYVTAEPNSNEYMDDPPEETTNADGGSYSISKQVLSFGLGMLIMLVLIGCCYGCYCCLMHFKAKYDEKKRFISNDYQMTNTNTEYQYRPQRVVQSCHL